MSLTIVDNIKIEQRQNFIRKQFEKLQEKVPANGEELDRSE